MAHPFRHFRTITKHRHKVIANCARVGILWQGLRHDLSKYSPTEFLPGAHYYTDGTRSPNERERLEHGCSYAWMHHKGRNRHHFEYWVDYNPEQRRQMPVKMPLKYVVEMFCDRVAASKIYMGDAYHDGKPLEYYLGGKANRIIHPDTAAMIEYFLRYLACNGEKTTFAFIRTFLRTHRDYSAQMLLQSQYLLPDVPVASENNSRQEENDKR